MTPFWASVVYLLAPFGFGTKAGLVPLHVWLPGAIDAWRAGRFHKSHLAHNLVVGLVSGIVVLMVTSSTRRRGINARAILLIA